MLKLVNVIFDHINTEIFDILDMSIYLPYSLQFLICCRTFVSQIMAHLKAYVEVNPTLTGPILEK